MPQCGITEYCIRYAVHFQNFSNFIFRFILFFPRVFLYERTNICVSVCVQIVHYIYLFFHKIYKYFADFWSLYAHAWINLLKCNFNFQSRAILLQNWFYGILWQRTTIARPTVWPFCRLDWTLPRVPRSNCVHMNGRDKQNKEEVYNKIPGKTTTTTAKKCKGIRIELKR